MEDYTGYNESDEEAVKNAKDCHPNVLVRAWNWCKDHPAEALTIGTAVISGGAYVGHKAKGVIAEHTTIQATVSNYSKRSHSKTSGKVKTKWFSSKQRNGYMKDVSDGMKCFDAMKKNGIRWK